MTYPTAKGTRRLCRCRVHHGINPLLVVTLLRDGTLVIREHRRRKEYRLAVGTLYTNCVVRDAISPRRKKR